MSNITLTTLQCSLINLYQDSKNGKIILHYSSFFFRFKWSHLNEQRDYEKAVSRQRLQKEIQQAKEESSFYISNVEFHKSAKEREKRGKKNTFTDDDQTWNWEQRLPEEEYMRRKLKRKMELDGKHSNDVTLPPNPKALISDHSFLSSMFSGGGVDHK